MQLLLLAVGATWIAARHRGPRRRAGSPDPARRFARLARLARLDPRPGDARSGRNEAAS